MATMILSVASGYFHGPPLLERAPIAIVCLLSFPAAYLWGKRLAARVIINAALMELVLAACFGAFLFVRSPAVNDAIFLAAAALLVAALLLRRLKR